MSGDGLLRTGPLGHLCTLHLFLYMPFRPLMLHQRTRHSVYSVLFGHKATYLTRIIRLYPIPKF